MKRPKESKRVSWASDPNLCQVNHFVEEDLPSQLASEVQNYQRKTPGGFRRTLYDITRRGASSVPSINWKCPPKLIINGTWRVTAGEESEERCYQKMREMKVFEALYPHCLAIPPQPYVSGDVESEHYDDSETPTVRVTPIEEEETSNASSITSLKAKSNWEPIGKPTPCQSMRETSEALRNKSGEDKETAPGKKPGFEADVVAAASAVLTALAASKEPGSLIDPDLLVKILRDPDLVNKLMKKQNAAPRKVIPNSDFSTALTKGVTVQESSDSRFKADKREACSSSLAGTLTATFSSAPQNMMVLQPTQPNPLVSTTLTKNITSVSRAYAGSKHDPPLKDPNYLKKLIREHGMAKTDIRENQEFGQTNSSAKTVRNVRGEQKSKIQKPCMYFNSSRGCKLGENCLYLHDTYAVEWRTGVLGSKRMKLDGEIAIGNMGVGFNDIA